MKRKIWPSKKKINFSKELNDSFFELEKENKNIKVNIHNLSQKNLAFMRKDLLSFTKGFLGNYIQNKRCKVEIWLKEDLGKGSGEVKCGVALKRPNKKVIYIKKRATHLGTSIWQCVQSLENAIRSETQYRRMRRRGLGQLNYLY